MRRLKVLAALAVMAGLSACSGIGRDAIARGIESGNGANDSLMPNTFAPSLTGAEVIRRLEAAGYKADQSRFSGSMKPQFPPTAGITGNQ